MAQKTTLTLDSCRALALSYNKQIQIVNEEISAARYERKAAFSNYLPKFSAEGAYIHNNKKTSLISDNQHRNLQTIGNAIHKGLGNSMEEISALLPNLSEITTLLSLLDIASPLNALGNSISDALTLDTRNIYIAAISLKQPIFSGGKITAYNKITRHAEEMAHLEKEQITQELIVATEEAYWQIISLANKRKLAMSLVSLIEKLRSDVEKMKDEGVATQSDLLNIDVKLNEAETALLKVENGESLARMLLCSLCGLPINSVPSLADENSDEFTYNNKQLKKEYNITNRPELKILETAIKIYRQQENITRADYLPNIGLTANYIISNPNMINGFRKNFRGIWNIGVVINIPIWNWGEGIYKTSSAKAQTNIAKYTYAYAQEKTELQIEQAKQQTTESNKRLILATSNVAKAEENLRTANIGFAEGVATSENVLEAQTSWLQAHSEKVDAQIDVILSELYLKRALGILEP